MVGEKKLLIQACTDGSVLINEKIDQKILQQIVVTSEDIITMIFKSTQKEDILEKIQKIQSAEKREQYEKLQPVGFDYAPTSAKKKWEEYKNTDNLEKLQWIHDNVSYNPDHTMTIIKLKKTFCEDVSGIGQRCNWEDAKQLAESKGYTLPSDYNDCDSDDVRQSSDRYKVINIFSNGNGDNVEGMELFRDMAGCNDRYWTATVYKDENGVENNDLTLTRYLFLKDLYRHWSYTYNDFRVCGLKDME